MPGKGQRLGTDSQESVWSLGRKAASEAVPAVALKCVFSKCQPTWYGYLGSGACAQARVRVYVYMC